MNTIRHRSPKGPANKIIVLMVFTFFITTIIIARLGYLQIVQHDYYQEKATSAHLGYTELPARRGDILIQDYHSGETFRVATNTTLDLLYADPILIKDPAFISEKLSPLLFNLEEEKTKDKERIDDLSRHLSPGLTEEEIQKLLTPKTNQELEDEFKLKLLQSLQQKQRQEILLADDLEQSNLENIQKENLLGIEIKDNKVFAFPPQIGDRSKTAKFLSKHIDINAKRLEQILLGENRYIVIKRKLHPDVSAEIKKLYKENTEEMLGIGLQEEYFRFYPEKSLASQIIGYLDHNNIGQYGIERKFNTQLQGEKGVFQTQKDSIGRQITVGDSIIKPAVNGDNIVLTIDRSIQLQTEKILAREVNRYKADSGQVIIIDPKTGNILAMANAPTFDPNVYGDVLKKEPINLTPEEIQNLVPYDEEQGMYYLYINQETGERIMIFKELKENGEVVYKKFLNKVGAEVYHNKVVSWPYEPGSVFKTIAMSAAIDDEDVTPQSTYYDTGPIEVDFNEYTGKYDYSIKNSTNEYYGRVTMTQILEKSLNTGMAYVAKKIGRTLFHSYMEKFGFGERTDIEFDNEETGKIPYYENWTESELITHAFGQGLTVTPLQMANAYAAIANGGILMHPHIVDRIEHDNGKTTQFQPQALERAISEESATLMTAMLVSSVENGVANPAQIEGHFIAGKTGTSQTYRGNRALTGPGTTITSFAGFAPINDPKFVILVKFDKPKAVEWGASTAAPTFKEIAKFLFDYYNIPPDKS